MFFLMSSLNYSVSLIQTLSVVSSLSILYWKTNDQAFLDNFSLDCPSKSYKSQVGPVRHCYKTTDIDFLVFLCTGDL